MRRQQYHLGVISSLAIVLVSLAACSKSDKAAAPSATGTTAAPAVTQQAQEDLSNVTNYRLTMDKYDKYLAAQRNMALKVKGLSPEQRQAMENSGSSDANASLDDMVKTLESQPLIASAVRDAGLSPREFALFTISMMQSSMAAGVLKMRPKDNQDSLIRQMQANPENVKFVQQHEAEITQKQKAIEADMKKLEGGQ
jgi:hypothetical protein